MRSPIDKIRKDVSRPPKRMLRTYAPNDEGVCVRVGRTYTSLGAAIRVAVTMSNKLDYVELKDDSRPIKERLIAIARKGLLLNDIAVIEGTEVLS